MKCYFLTICAMTSLVFGQVGSPPGNPDTPFKVRHWRTFGLPKVAANDGVGEDKAPVEHRIIEGRKQDCVCPSVYDGPDRFNTVTSSVGTGEMEVTDGPLGLMCRSLASGLCKNESDEDGSGASYDVKARSEVQSSNAHPNKSYDLKIVLSGDRSEDSLVPPGTEEFVDGIVWVKIKGANGTADREYIVEVIRTGWKPHGKPVILGTTFELEIDETLAPGESIDVRSVSKAFGDVGGSGLFGEVRQQSRVSLTAKVTVIPEATPPVP